MLMIGRARYPACAVCVPEPALLVFIADPPGAAALHPAAALGSRRPSASATARARGGMIEVLVPGSGPIEGGQLVSSSATVLTDRHLTATEAWSWMLWWRSERIEEAVIVHAIDVTDGSDAVELTLHCDRLPRATVAVEEAKADVNAAEHAAMAANRNPGSHFSGTASWRAQHSDQIAGSSRQAATDARARASEHQQMAAAVAAN